MLFSSTIFLTWFLPIFLIAYLSVPQKLKNTTALLGSLIFYAWGAPIFCLVLVVSSAIDHFLSKGLDGPRSKLLLSIGVGVNVLTLFVFKYFNFFMENAHMVADAFGFGFPTYMQIALPLGISFFTFQKISYLVDVYRRDAEPARSYWDYLLYVALFPQLIAGPIVRFKDIAGQIIDRSENETWVLRLAGFQRYALGLLKKVLIADVLGVLADHAFAADQLGTLNAIVGLLGFSFQIYFDFSAYSDMAIGIGLMMGFRLPENFDWPYAAHGFRSFWRKWHMTLSTWMRDYLYHPLGGNRVGYIKTIRNLWIVFLISGLWHGASWNFVVWGMWHGFFLTLDRNTQFFKRYNPWVGGLMTFGLVTLGWIFFRAETFGDVMHYFRELLRWDLSEEMTISSREWFTLMVATVFAFLPPTLHDAARHYHGDDGKRMVVKTMMSILFIILCLGQLAVTGEQPFIYFRF